MCERFAILRLGHVVARWMHEWIKAEGNGKIHCKLPSLGISHAITQDGVKHYLLCDDCEQRMSDAEGYMRSLMVGGTEGWKAIGTTEDTNEVLYGIDFERVQHFLLGTALRAHFATGAEFHNFHVPEDQVPPIRSALLHPPGRDDEFPIVAVRYFSRYPNVDPRAFVYLMFCHIPGYAPAVRLFAAGWEWIMFLRGGRPQEEDALLSLRLRPGQGFHVSAQEVLEHPNIRSFLPAP